jgi:hypothetical protein
MTYKVIAFFTDLQDRNRPYNVGDIFPHAEAAYTVTESRLAELSGSENKRGMPLIQLVEEATEEKPKKKRAKKTAEK